MVIMQVGIVGVTNGSTILNCDNSGNIQGENYIGGISGIIEDTSSVSTCYNSGNINGNIHSIGGIVGCCGGNSSISNCYNIGNVVGGYYVGGITGTLYDSFIINCYNNASITANNHTELGSSCIGGICGMNNSNSNTGNIQNVYNSGIISGLYSYVGGIIGSNNGNLSNSYNTGTVSGNLKGGIVGGNGINDKKYGVIKNSYCLNNNEIDLCGSNNGTISTESSLKSSSELKQLHNTLGKNFKQDTNNINNGYPILTWQ